MQDWYIEKRKAIEEIFIRAEPIAESAEVHASPSGRFALDVVRCRTGPKSWPFSRGLVKNCESGDQIAVIHRNYGAFPFSWAENHPNGQDYLVAGEDYQGQTIIELGSGRRVDYVPEAAERGFGFCWAAHYPSPDVV